jgi:hypothetical protein
MAMHLADSNDGSGDVSFSYAVTSAGLSSSSILIRSSLVLFCLGCSCSILAISRIGLGKKKLCKVATHQLLKDRIS